MSEIKGNIYNTAERRFQYGKITYTDKIESVSFEEDGEKEDVYIVPGLIDIHMHIESSMTHPEEFSRVSLRHGTTTIVSDCHETANVFGLEGLKDFMDSSVYNDTFYAIPSSVPASSPALETSFGNFDEAEVKALCRDEKIITLGEVMNADDLFSAEDNRTKRIIKAFKEERPSSPIEGHIPRFGGEFLDRFISSGVSSDHTEQTPESIKEKLSKGVFLEIQYKSVNKANIKALSKPEYAPFFCLCTDDVMPDVLVSEGHLDRVLRKAIECGMRIEDAVFASTYTPAERMNLKDRGIIAPGRIADFVVLSDKANFTIKGVYKRGRKADAIKPRPYNPPEYTLHSLKREETTPEDLNPGTEKGVFLTIVHKENSTMTEKGKREIDLSKPLPEGVNIIAQVERYGHGEKIKPALIENAFTKPGAIASSWAHDNHNILVMATDREKASEAVNRVIRMQGGIVALDENETIEVPLSYGGIVSLEPLEVLAERIKEVRRFMREHGWKAGEEIMSFAVLALPVSPEVKITDKGLVDVKAKEIVNWKTYWS